MPTTMLNAIQDELDLIIKESGRSSYMKKLPCKRVLPPLFKIISNLKEILKSDPKNIKALFLISLAEEVRLNYKDSIQYLKEYLALANSKKDKKIKKRLALLTQQYDFWCNLKISPEQYAELMQFLETHADYDDLRFTRQWLEINASHAKDTIEFLEQLGYLTDWSVLEVLMKQT